MARAARSGDVGERPLPPAPSRRLPKDEEVVAAATKIILEEETLGSQKRFLDLVLRELRRREPIASLSGTRLRKLALRSGLVSVAVRVRVEGTTPTLARCPVCHSTLERTANRTLAGTAVSVGYRCVRCPWWTGRDHRVPTAYTFTARLARGRDAQTRFSPGVRRL